MMTTIRLSPWNWFSMRDFGGIGAFIMWLTPKINHTEPFMKPDTYSPVHCSIMRQHSIQIMSVFGPWPGIRVNQQRMRRPDRMSSNGVAGHEFGSQRMIVYSETKTIRAPLSSCQFWRLKMFQRLLRRSSLSFASGNLFVETESKKQLWLFFSPEKCGCYSITVTQRTCGSVMMILWLSS